ncbi:hypothetical protein AAFN86_11650 [Roseomonas sp. CAU 1739]|uniref:hypothetical protein n=1 Tax=Roseomonas sp. CAU 1739 TaxID=3140364 RepID=UPI00325BA08F
MRRLAPIPEMGIDDPIAVVSDRMTKFAAALEAGDAQVTQLEGIVSAGHLALSAQSRRLHVASRADRGARGPQPARRVRLTRPEHLIRLSNAEPSIFDHLGVGRRWGRADLVNVPPALRAALEIGEDETQEDADRLAFDRIAYLFQHRPAFARDCVGLRLPEGGMPAETVGIEPPRHAPIPEPDTEGGRALYQAGSDAHAKELAEDGGPAFPSRIEEGRARSAGWRAMLKAHRERRRATGASIGEAQAEREVALLVPGWASAVGLKPVPR